MEKKILLFDCETTSLSGFDGRIVAIGYKLIGTNPSVKCLMMENEKEMLEKFITLLEQHKPTLVGYNIRSFDITFLRLRCLKHGVNCAVLDGLQKIDLMNTVSGLVPYKKRLSDWSCFLGLSNNSFEHSGAQVPELWANRDFESIKKHAVEDVERTERLYDALVKSGILKK